MSDSSSSDAAPRGPGASGSATGPVPDLSVIVMTFNRPASLGRCLESLRAQVVRTVRFEVVVVDGSREPAVAAVAGCADALRIRHVIGPNLGIAGNRNRGAAHAEGRYLAFLDDDCLARPDWLETLGRAVAGEPDALVGGGIANESPENACAAAGQVITEAVVGFFNPPGAAPTFFPGLNFAVERARYLEIGGCDPRFGLMGGGEDRDLCDRWRAHGGRLVHCPGAIVLHQHRTSLRGFCRQYYGYGRGAWLYRRIRRESRRASAGPDPGPRRSLYGHLADALGRLERPRRGRVLALIGVWRVAYALGILRQAVGELGHRPRP